MIAVAETFAPERVNISRRLTDAAERLPNKAAIIEPGGRVITFAELESLVAHTAAGLSRLGVERGKRALMFVPPSIEFFSMTFALFRLGALPVMIDPGLGRQGLLRAVADAEPEVMIGVPKAHLARVLFPKAFRSVTIPVTAGRRWLWGGATAAALAKTPETIACADTLADEPAAILFTSGSTGPAKGAIYTHGIFDGQVDIIRREWGIGEDELDLPAFPLFALFSTGLGVTSILPDMDASRPGSVDPVKIIAAARKHQPTYSFGSPAFWIRVASHCQQTGERMDSLRRVFIAGAPVTPKLVAQIKSVLSPAAEVMVPYGATESLPVAWIRGAEVAELRERSESGAGLCVGRPIAESEVRIIAISDGPLEALPPALPPDQIGEITVSGKVTTPGYHRRPDEDRKAKIREKGRVWHRMGDLGFFDQEGRLWYCGRKSHRVESAGGPLYSNCCEPIFDRHPRVRRSALVGVGTKGSQRPVVVVECLADQRPRDKADETALIQELLALARSTPITRSIEDVMLYPGELPVDVRHNAKIRRELLAPWAAERL